MIRRASPICRFRGALSRTGSWQAFFCHARDAKYDAQYVLLAYIVSIRYAPNASLTAQFDKMHVSLEDSHLVSVHKQAKSVTSHIVRVKLCVTQVIWKAVSRWAVSGFVGTSCIQRMSAVWTARPIAC